MKENNFVEYVLKNREDAEILLKAYVNNDDIFPAYKLAMEKSCKDGITCFNMLGFLFGMVYFVYHKLYLPGLILFLIGVIIPYILPTESLFWAAIILSVFTGSFFFRFYFNRFFRIIQMCGYGELPLSEVVPRVKTMGGKDNSAYVIFAAMTLISLAKAYIIDNPSYN